MNIIATYREPFGVMPQVQRLRSGITLSDMRASMRGLPDDFDQIGVICLNGHPVPRGLWGAIRPKAPAITEVTFHAPPMGGGGDDGKNVFALVASIALTVVSGGIASGAYLGGLTGASLSGGATIASLTLAAGVSLGGSLLLSALIPPPSVQSGSSSRADDAGNASANGNVLAPNTPIPRVLGERKVFPPLAVEPFTYFDGPDEVVEAAYVLAGPHRINDIRVGAALIADMADVETEIREGWTGDPLITLLRRQSRTDPVQAELRGHVVSADDNRTLETGTGGALSSLPQAQIFATKDDPDEYQMQIAFAQGLGRSTGSDDRLRVPFRLRMRQVGSATWINMPELHFQAARLGQIRATVRVVWSDDAASTPSAASGEGWVEARALSPAQSVAPSGGGWQASAYFTGVGAGYMNSGNLGATGVKHTSLDRYTAEFRIDDAVFPRGRYEFEVVRGCAFLQADFASSNYQYGGVVWNFFGYQGTPGKIAMSKDNIVDTAYVLRSVSIWNEHPLPSRDVAVIAVRARNRVLDGVSCIAGGYVKDWNGSGWSNWTVTDNPAPHLRDIYIGAENADPVPLDMIDDDGLVVWRQHCIDEGYNCNALIEDQTVDDAARIVASCGYARPYMSEVWGVIRDYDRSAESPMQIFSPRNIANFRWTKSFARVPEGFRVNFPDASRDYETSQISVFRPGNSDDSGRMEQITYEGLVDRADAVAHAEYDQMQAQIRNTFYSWECAAESILCRRGDLIGLQHDALMEWAGSALILGIETDGSGDITDIQLDSSLNVQDYYFMDGSPNLSGEENLALLGLKTGIAIRRNSGSTIHQISSSNGVWLSFDPPIDPDGIDIGSLVVTGPVGQEYLRLVVFGVSPKPNFEATITAVDEAPQLWN